MLEETGVHTERTTDLPQVTDKLYYILLPKRKNKLQKVVVSMFEKNVLQPVARNSHLKNACRSMLTRYLKYKMIYNYIIVSLYFYL
jgi:hypothetical protein